MHQDGKTLLDLTYALSDAVERGDAQESARLLARRGRFLTELAGRLDAMDAVPEALRQAFDTVRRLDADLETRLCTQRETLGRELVRLGAQKSREVSTTSRQIDLKV